MINDALTVLKDAIQGYLIRLPELNVGNEQRVHLSAISNSDGTVAIPQNTLGISLVNIEEERVTKVQIGTQVTTNGNIRYLNPEIKLNIYFFICANFDNYDTGLRYLSAAIEFFQNKSLFRTEDTPALNPAIKRLTIELISLNFEEQNHLWGAIGAKYLPSVMYRARLLTIQAGMATDEQSPVLEITADSGHIK